MSVNFLFTDLEAVGTTGGLLLICRVLPVAGVLILVVLVEMVLWFLSFFVICAPNDNFGDTALRFMLYLQ